MSKDGILSGGIRLLIEQLKWCDHLLQSGRLNVDQIDQCRKAKMAILEVLQFIGQFGDVSFSIVNDMSTLIEKATQGGEVNIVSFLNALSRALSHRKNTMDHITEQIQAAAFRIDEFSRGLPPLPKTDEAIGQVT